MESLGWGEPFFMTMDDNTRIMKASDKEWTRTVERTAYYDSMDAGQIFFQDWGMALQNPETVLDHLIKEYLGMKDHLESNSPTMKIRVSARPGAILIEKVSE